MFESIMSFSGLYTMAENYTRWEKIILKLVVGHIVIDISDAIITNRYNLYTVFVDNSVLHL